jgi:hypothetical protein
MQGCDALLLAIATERSAAARTVANERDYAATAVRTVVDALWLYHLTLLPGVPGVVPPSSPGGVG